MPIDTMFVAFAAALAWGQRQSRPVTELLENGERKRRSF